MSMRAVVGRPERATPVVRGRLHTVVLNPAWTIPTKLAFEQYIPAQEHNPGYFASHHIEVLSNRLNGERYDPTHIGWSRLSPDYFPYLLRQSPGPTNPLGRIEFLFSNAFDIYLHDTPNRYLFERHQRTFSAGCIRLEQPLRLADWVMDGARGWDQDRLQAAIATGQTQEIAPPRAIPVYVVYWTAWVGEHGGVHFDNDVYGRDCALIDCTGKGRVATGQDGEL